MPNTPNTTNPRWTAEAMRELGERHARVETAGDLDATMATLVESPVYDFWPIGRRATGRDQVLRYYEHLVSEFMPSMVGFTLIEEWHSESSLIQEYEVDLGSAERSEKHRIIGVLFASTERDGLLGGERIWGSEAVLRKMVGPVWDELEIISE
ncbi:MAG: hypothetical protein AB8G23_06870 [Myxococcota bacterium]